MHKENRTMRASAMMDPDATETRYLPAARDHEEIIDRQRLALLSTPMTDILEDLPMLLLVTNDKRQIVWMNRKAREVSRSEDAIGSRPGEALGCLHAHELPGGCGTTAFCAFCGTPSAIMNALAGATDSEECIIQRDERHDSDTLNLLVWTKPVQLGNERLVLLSAQDISERKRHEVLERIFYHDIGNTVGGIVAILNLIEDDEHPTAEYMRLLRAAADQLIEEIGSQRSIKAAEQGELATTSEPVPVRSMIERSIAMFEYQLYGKDTTIEIDDSRQGGARPAGSSGTLCIETDPVLLRRVLDNMFKNALEASEPGDTVRVGYDEEPDTVSIWVWNASPMSQETKMRVFQRSYSTKGRGRGLGTYGMKMLTERYLQGTISFDSEDGSGTTFRIRIPKTPETPASLP
ncbi:MAG: sensor histidine kinase [Spirochaetae bacterium HGW-Spirochaetae-7]|jgi:signal transduction histidine kinase|nr:MAG: sensor histidine kinase [Spirochaetae bacterium HGW-Spirochaetae-7]